MSAVDLLQPILDGGLQRNNFFNGRLLSAEDLRAEQKATGIQVSHLARADGDGVGWGFGVSVSSVGPQRPRVLVRRGLALNRLGNLLHLPEDSEVALVPAAQAADAALGLFAECEPPRPQESLIGHGAYVLVVAPSSGYSGTALVSDPNTTSAGRGACGARFTVAGVRFRLVPMWISELDGVSDTLRAQILGLLPPAPNNTSARERLRNKLAHLCFGTQTLGFAELPRLTAVKPVAPGWGALDAMRTRGDLTDCDVPLAVVVLTPDGISFVDMWAARRRLIDAAAIDQWRGVASPRRIAEGEAAFLQFQAQLDVVKTFSAPGNIVASTYFDVLPPGGWLPVDSGGFDWQRFLGPHAPPSVTPVDAALLRGILERSWFDEPFALATTPPVPVRVFKVPEQAGGESFVVFARSSLGNIRVTLSPAPASNAVVEVTATAATGALTRATTRSGGTVPIPELQPGPHSVAVTAPDYLPVTPQTATVIGGRTVDVSIGLTPLPNGSILVNAVDAATGESLGQRVSQVSATGGGIVRAGTFQMSTGRWLIEDLPAGTYTVSGTASGYVAASNSSVGPTARGTQISTTLLFRREVREPKEQPPKCVNVKAIERPALKTVRLCLVLEASEFEEDYFYGVWTHSKTGPNSDKMRMKSRSPGKSPQSNRYTGIGGEIVYGRAPWLDRDMLPVEPLPPEVRSWLLKWREWFAEELNDKNIQKSEPLLFIDRSFFLSRGANDVPTLPPAYAVFHHFSVPVAIKSVDLTTKKPYKFQRADFPGLPEEVLERLYEVDIRYLDDLGWSWEELILDATGQEPDDVRYLISDAADLIRVVNQERRYYGVDKETDKILKDLGINDDVALANFDKDRLAEKVGSKGFAIRLIDQARKIVSRDAWSLEGLGLSERQVDGLKGRGIESKGDLVNKAGTAGGRADIAEGLGIEGEAAAAKEAAVAAVTNEAVTIMTASSIMLAPQLNVATWSKVDSMTASKLGKAGFVTVDDLGKADAGAVSEAAGISLADATTLVDDAKAASGTGISVGTLAPVTRAEEGRLKDLFGADKATIGGIALKSVDELAGAFGGNIGRANAIRAGVEAGLAGRGLK
jgi:hypothetical protein